MLHQMREKMTACLLVDEVPKNVNVAVSAGVCREDVVVGNDHHAFRIPNLPIEKGAIAHRLR